MQIFSKRTLRSFWEKYGDCEQALKSWYKEANSEIWKSPNDIKSKYPRASILKNGRVIFDICGNKYRLIVAINYEKGWVFIRFVGNHSDYDKINAETI